MAVVTPTSRPPAASRPPAPGRVTARPSSPTATFRYAGVVRSAWITWMAVFASGGLHALLLLGFNQHTAVQRTAVVPDPPSEMLMMPELEEEEEEKPRDLTEEEEPADPSVAVPSLMDIPVNIEVDNSFTQLIDVMVPAKIDATALSHLTIPVNIQRGRPDASRMKDLFNIADLDRKPEAVIQPSPVFPYELKESIHSARVRVGFIVTSKGDVVMAYIVTSTHRGFERAALDAVAKWKFKPGMRYGRKVNTQVEQPIDFSVVDPLK